MRLRPYQAKTVDDVFRAWENPEVRNVLACAGTGTGKTPIEGAIIERRGGGATFIAHRSELLSQASLLLAKYGIRHRVIGPPILSARCTKLHLTDESVGCNFVDRSAQIAVAGINTLVKMDPKDPLFRNTKTWVVDEGHHLLRDNIWGRGVAMFTHPDVRGLLATATPGRPDGKGLGRHADGLVDQMVMGAQMRWAIKSGYLTPYKVYSPPSDVDYSGVNVTASGDLSPARLSAAVHASKTFVGEIVDDYLTIAPGKLGITFCVDVDEAMKVAAEYNRRGVRAAVITGDTDPDVRNATMNKFRKREVIQLVSVDILGEGVDVPAVEVVSMGRRTESFIVYAQQFGRMVRLFLSPILMAAWDTYTDEQRVTFIASSEKPFGILIDHVGNFARHGPPDAPREWSLDRRERVSRGTAPSDVEPQRTCLNPNGVFGEGIPCQFTYSRVLPACPECGHVPVPANRSAPEHVDGDLVELDPAILAILLGEVARVDTEVSELATTPVIPPHMPPAGQAAYQKRHFEKHAADRQAHYDRRDAQHALRPVMEVWGGWRAHEGDTVSMTQRRFFHSFGHDVMSAMTLGATEAEALKGRIETALASANVISSY